MQCRETEYRKLARIEFKECQNARRNEVEVEVEEIMSAFHGLFGRCLGEIVL
jgi:hypothetical protein